MKCFAGCGKGTQCDKIVAKYKFSHLSTGDLLRAEVASGSPKGKELLEIMTKGGLVSNDIVLELLAAAMQKIEGATGFLIDGWDWCSMLMKLIFRCELFSSAVTHSYPREQAQGAAFEKAIAPVDLILYFECSNVSWFEIWAIHTALNTLWNHLTFSPTKQETLVARILKRAAASTEKRADDNEETLKTRIATFRENTEKILVQYPAKLKRIDAERDVDTIYGEVVAAIDETLVKKSA